MSALQSLSMFFVFLFFFFGGACDTNIHGVHYRYKDLEAAQAAGKGLGFLPPPVAAPNATLLRNGKSARDRNRMVAPLIISEAFG